MIRLLEDRIWSRATYDDEEGLWVISGGISWDRQFSRSIEQTRDGITYEEYPSRSLQTSLPKTLARHCFVSLGKGDLFLAGGFNVSFIQCVHKFIIHPGHPFYQLNVDGS